MSSLPEIRSVRGPELVPWLADVARLRTTVFREWPYLYDGRSDSSYERDYLQSYARSPDSVLVLVLDEGKVVGASTGLPLADDPEDFSAPLRRTGLPVPRVFYFGESMLLPRYRGQGIGHVFFDLREAHARSLGRFRWTAFCAVDRDPDDPRRPPGYRPNDSFWHTRGYARLSGLSATLCWDEVGVGAVDHRLTFWLRDWEGVPG